MLSSLETKSYALNRKIDTQKHKKIARDAKTAKMAEYYRKFMGIDIVPEKQSILKIVFSNFTSREDAKGYVLIDFGGEGVVVDIFPLIFSAEKAQMYFKKYTNFHEFLKFLRTSFKKEFEEK